MPRGDIGRSFFLPPVGGWNLGRFHACVFPLTPICLLQAFQVAVPAFLCFFDLDGGCFIPVLWSGKRVRRGIRDLGPQHLDFPILQDTSEPGPMGRIQGAWGCWGRQRAQPSLRGRFRNQFDGVPQIVQVGRGLLIGFFPRRISTPRFANAPPPLPTGVFRNRRPPGDRTVPWRSSNGPCRFP